MNTGGNGSAGPMPFAEVLARWGPDYVKSFPAMPWRQREVLAKLLACRTPALGGSLYACPKCGDHHYAYHSCNDRHCPRCGGQETDAWLARQEKRLLLPVPYFLVTFTVPEELRGWIRSHPKVGYDMLFAASAQAMQELAGNSKGLNGSLGMLGVLHTWSRTLIFHPHIHYLVPGGALSLDGRQWRRCPKNYLLAVKALALRFRTLVREALRREDPQAMESIPGRVWKQKWWVYSKAVGGGQNALRYLGRYIFKTATGDRRLNWCADGTLRWPYRESNTGAARHVDLEPSELIRRFLQHVLPKGYTRVRCFGWWHPAAQVKLNRVRALLRQKPMLTQAQMEAWQTPEDWSDSDPPEEEPREKITPVCRRCQVPMRCQGRWRAGNAPPMPPPRGPPMHS
jgi:hypothetical protein